MKTLKKYTIMLIVFLTVNLTLPQAVPIFESSITAEAATIKLNKKNVTLSKGKNCTLKIIGTKKKATWKSSNKKVATVSSKGKITAKKEGSAKITAKIGKSTLSCKVTVTAKPESTESSANMVWISQNGSKYHKNSSCSNMKHPEQISKKDAVSQGYTPCKKCY